MNNRKSLVSRILAWFGLCSKKECTILEQRIDCTTKTLLSEREDFTRIIANNTTIIGELTADNNRLTSHIREVEFSTMAELKIHNEMLEKDNAEIGAKIKENEKFYLEVQKRLSDGFHEDVAWRFPYSRAIPGSTVIDGKSNEDGSIDIIGRFIIPSDDNARIKMHEKAIDGRIKLSVDMIRQFGMYDRLVDMLVSYNLLGATLGYNDECTAIECYYKFKAMPFGQ